MQQNKKKMEIPKLKMVEASVFAPFSSYFVLIYWQNYFMCICVFAVKRDTGREREREVSRERDKGESTRL